MTGLGVAIAAAWLGTIAVAVILARRLRAARRTASALLERAHKAERKFAESFDKSPLALALTHATTQQLAKVNDAYLDMVAFKNEKQTRTQQIARVELDGVPHTLSVLVDDTERTRTQAALRASDDLLRDLASSLDDVFWVMTPTLDRVLYASPSYERLTGRSIDDLYGNAFDWLDVVHPDDREHVVRTFATRAQLPERHELDFRIIRPGGVRWIRAKSFWVRDERGQIARIAGVIEDVTKQRLLEDQLRQSQKMDSLGLLAGGVAHDFNNLLAVIAACSGLLADSNPPGSPDRELVDEIEGAIGRATDLTRQLLAFSRKQIVEPSVLDLNKLVKDTSKMLRRMVRANVSVDLSLEPELASVRADPGHLVQVLMNLVVNARDAMPDGGRLWIETRNVEHARIGRAVVVSVVDSGCGMAEEVRARIFEPFFTTKARGKGTGMGLAVVHGIVDQASGLLEVDSHPGVGTTFRVVLPAFEVPEVQEPAPPVVGAKGFETVLVVDDDEYVRRSAAHVLRNRGYNVLEARDGFTAIGVLSERPVDLVLTDLMMPGMDGRALAEAARTNRPKLKVLFMSGYADDVVVRESVGRGELELIEKPFRVPALAAKVREVLDEGVS